MSSHSIRTERKATLRLESLEVRENPSVNYYGGALLAHVEAQPVYYGAGWTADPTTRTTIDASVKDLVGGAYMDALTQAGYGVGRGSASAGVVDPINLASGTMITDASIQAELKADITAGRVQPVDANRLYVVYVQPNVAVNLGAGQGTTQQGILGYHGSFVAPNGQMAHYAVIAYPGGTVHNTSLGTSAVDQLTSTASHEIAEAATDPNVDSGTLGWYDPRYGEIGDITENNPNALVRLDGYLVQEVADRNDRLLSVFTTAPVSPPPVTTTTTATSTSVTAGAVHYYGWYATAQITVTVRPASGSALPGGTVTLYSGGQALGTGTLRVVNGVATVTFNVVFYANGIYDFEAGYGGNSSFQGSTSPATLVAV